MLLLIEKVTAMTTKKLEIKQWVSSIVDIESNSQSKINIGKIIGTPILPKPELEIRAHEQNFNEFKITLKIDQKVYIDELDIYEIVGSAGLLIQIEAKDDENGK